MAPGSRISKVSLQRKRQLEISGAKPARARIGSRSMSASPSGSSAQGPWKGPWKGLGSSDILKKSLEKLGTKRKDEQVEGFKILLIMKYFIYQINFNFYI